MTTKNGSSITITLAMLLSKYLDQGCDFLQRCLMVGDALKGYRIFLNRSGPQIEAARIV